METLQSKCVLCGRKPYSRNLCHYCYNKELRLGRISKYKLVLTPISIETRVKKTHTCWLWTGDKTSFGYGCVTTGRGSTRKRTQAHRYVYEQLVGPIPNGKIVMHLCDNPPCVNPKHLKIGTIADNQSDMQAKRRSPRGLKHWNGRLTDAQVRAIRKSTETQVVLCARYNVSQAYISRLRRVQRRVHV